MTESSLIGSHEAVRPLLTRRPPHWSVVRFKAALVRRDVRNTDLSYEMLSLRSSGDVVPRALLGERQEPDSASLPRYLVAEVNDLVVNPMWLIGGGIGVSTLTGAVSPDYRVFRPRSGLDPRFLHYLLRSKPYLDQYVLYTRAQTTFDRRVQQGDLDNLPVLLPPNEEQHVIADFLDRETARIDTLIGEQQRLVEMLRERRAAALVDAFASMSGGSTVAHQEPIPWLPELSVNQAQMRHLCTIRTGSSDSANAVDDGYPFFVRGDQPLALDTYEFDTEAIITAGDGAMVGRSFHHFQGKFAAHQRVYVLHDFAGVVPRYLFWYFSTFFIRVVGDGGAQATVPSVRMPMIAGMPVPVPTLLEQRRIAAYLDEQTTKIDSMIAETERFINLARERRTALITAAVTGQIDVQGQAVNG